MKKFDRVHSIVTTKTPNDWSYIKQRVKEKYDNDINKYVPVFLTLKDFEINHDRKFNASDILISWWQYGKMPVILLESEEEFESLDETKKFMLKNTCAFID